MANPLQQTTAKEMEREINRFRKNGKLICIRNVDHNCDNREFENACRERLTLAEDVKFLWPAPDRRGRKNRGLVFLGFDDREDCKAALNQLHGGFDFNGLRVKVAKSYRVRNAQRFSEDLIVNSLRMIATAPMHLLARASRRAPVLEAMKNLAAASPEDAERILEPFLSRPTATISTSSSGVVPVLGAGPIEEPTTSATSCNDTVQPETVAVQSEDVTMQEDSEDLDSGLQWPGANDSLSDIDY
ncbi:unnamed protein product [Clonostachys rosea]|uniref:RRM domain-containing protein n=1 Tax=Bionectria ochroleuca TaxID=29856 RepID=A0ABY6TYS2_BIOOC|nr:unnamed protein product [Clonostachys rosea]